MKQLNFGSTNGVPNDPDKTVVHCPTQELAQKVLRIANFYYSTSFVFETYGNETCMRGTGYGSIGCYQSIGYTILPAEEFIRLNTTERAEVSVGSPFQVGDKIFHHVYGWQLVKHVSESGNLITKEGNVLSPSFCSFTEYTLQGFSQERPKPEIKEGQLIYVKSNEGGEWLMRYFSHWENDDNVLCFENQMKSGNVIWWPEYSLTNPLEEK